MSFSTGKKLKISIFGQSHSEAMGVVIEGLPAGEDIDMEQVGRFMSRRAPGKDKWSTTRKEADLPEILSGLTDGKTCGAPLCAVIRNTNQRSRDYDTIRKQPRPSHADFTAWVRYHGFNDIRGGGQFSGRLTAPLCFAGAVCLQILQRRGIEIGAHIAEIAGVQDVSFNELGETPERLHEAGEKIFPVLDDNAGAQMREKIEEARMELDSVGGIVECEAIGFPAGLGEPMFDGLENRIAHVVFGIPAVKGVEFGSGFGAARMRGSENNDPFFYEGQTVKTKTNHHGGSLGGISSGMPVVFRAAFKPTPSIGRMQDSINLETGKNISYQIEGRHDPCVVPRAVPCVEAAAAVALLDLLLEG